MENNNSSKIILTYGIILGVASLILSVANYAFGDVIDPNIIVKILGFLLFIGVIVYGINIYKTQNSGFLRLGEAIKIAVGIALISGIIAALYQYVFTNFIDLDFIERQTEFMQQKMLEDYPEMDEEMIEKQAEMTSNIMNSPILSLAITIAGSMIGGLLVGLISGLFMKKEETEF